MANFARAIRLPLAMSCLAFAACGPPVGQGMFLLRLHPKAGTSYTYTADYREWGASANPKTSRHLTLRITLQRAPSGFEATVAADPSTTAALALNDKGQVTGSKGAEWLTPFGLTAAIDLIPLPEPPVRLHNYWQEAIDLKARYPILAPVLKGADYTLTQTSEDIRQNYKTVDVLSSLDDFLPMGKGAGGPLDGQRLHVSESDHLYLDTEDGMPLIADRRIHIQIPGSEGFEVNSEATLTRVSPAN